MIKKWLRKKGYLKSLAAAFQDQHGYEAFYLETVPVKETFKGHPVWEGDVEVFILPFHPKTKRGYAWSYEVNGVTKYIAVVEVPPVYSPLTAVHAFLISNAEK